MSKQSDFVFAADHQLISLHWAQITSSYHSNVPKKAKHSYRLVKICSPCWSRLSASSFVLSTGDQFQVCCQQGGSFYSKTESELLHFLEASIAITESSWLITLISSLHYVHFVVWRREKTTWSPLMGHSKTYNPHNRDLEAPMGIRDHYHKQPAEYETI